MRVGAKLRGWIARLVVMLAVSIAMPLQAEQVRLSMDEARGMAARLIAAGRPEQALTIAEGILVGHPQDVPALLLKSRALHDMGREEDALAAVKMAWEHADKDEDRFYAALVMAQTRASDGYGTWAQLWLRRAAQVAPDDGLRQLAVRDFQQARRASPLRMSVNLTFAPSDNLNGAPKTNTFSFAGLPFVNPSAVPLSGLRYGVGLDVVRRVPLDAHRRINLRAGIDVERVRQSRKSRALGILRDSDMRRDVATLGFGYEQIAPDGQWLFRGDVGYSRYWYGGQAVSDSARADLSFGHSLGKGVTLTGRAGIEQEWRHDLSLRDALTKSTGLTLTHKGAAGTLAFDMSFAGTASESRSVARQTARASVSYRLAKPVRGMLPSVSLVYEAVDFDQSPATFWADPRVDREWRVSFDVLLPDMDYMGFAPEIGISFRDRSSNYSLYETQSTDVRFGLKSVF